MPVECACLPDNVLMNARASIVLLFVCLSVCFDVRPPTAVRVSASKQSHIESLDLESQVVPFYWTLIMDMV